MSRSSKRSSKSLIWRVLRDVALHYDAPKLAALVDRNEIPADAQVPIADGNLRLGVATFLENQSDFNIRTTSILQTWR